MFNKYLLSTSAVTFLLKLKSKYIASSHWLFLAPCVLVVKSQRDVNEDQGGDKRFSELRDFKSGLPRYNLHAVKFTLFNTQFYEF